MDARRILSVLISGAFLGVVILMLVQPHTSGGQSRADASGDWFGTPVPVSPPSSNALSDSQSDSVVVTPVYQKMELSLADRVVYQVKYQFVNFPASPDPANGKVVLGNVWTWIGIDGVPTRYHALYTLSDGTFHQEILQTGGQAIFVLGSNYGLESRCEQTNVSEAEMRALLPVFIDGDQLSRFGFASQGVSSFDVVLPEAQLPTGARPIESYGYIAGQNVTRWKRQVATSLRDGRRASQSVIIAAGESGYLMLDSSRVLNDQGGVYSEEIRASGPLLVIDPTTVPDSIWNLSQDAQEICK